MSDELHGGNGVGRPLLFQPLKIRGLLLKNRLAVPSMVQFQAGPGNTCSDFHLVHLGRFAMGGFGLVFVEVTAVEEQGLNSEHDLGLWNDAQVESFSRLTAFMKRHNAASAIQLSHGGRKSATHSAIKGFGPVTEQDAKAGHKRWQPVAPSAIPVADGWQVPRPLTVVECAAMVDTFVAAAKRAVAAGFDVIEILIAHGYLLASFVSPISNTRDDEYGGDRGRRMRLPLEIVEAVRREIPDSMPLFVRISAVDGAVNGWNMDDTVALSHELKIRGVDVVDISSGGISRIGGALSEPVPRSLGFHVPYADRVRNEVDIKTMVAGIILEAQQAEAILRNGQADLIGIARQSLFNPNVAHHWGHDLGINLQFEDWPYEHGFWLEKRKHTIQDYATPRGEITLRAQT
ncbi:2,4-dienoyl-CoA reductase-like NADH-dependent reductase (Old Yellow Enzyme family) [Bradyrhizobium sp. AZCC 2262]|uniref:oxidoreductase n=1 Tax=Bradyrhizobium sp. AZCC 2262 TaxID=3117022 RepID=UPI002FF1C909